MATANQMVVQAAFGIADEIDGVAIAMGMPKSHREQINAKLQERLKIFAETILDQALAAGLTEQPEVLRSKSHYTAK